MLKNANPYKELMSQAAQCTLQVLDRSWKSYFVAIKDWKNNPSKYLGMPKLPKYKKKGGRFPWFIKNNTSYIKDGMLYFRLRVFKGKGFKTNVKGRLISVRFIPKGSCYAMEIIYETEVCGAKEDNGRVLGIDLGVNNFVTMVDNTGRTPIIINGRGIKSVNQYYNKRKAKLQSELMKRNNKYWSNRLEKLTLKRENKLNNYIHHASKFIVNYCKFNNVNTIVIGKNKEWKQNCKLYDNQQFVYIPYEKLIWQIKYKAENIGVNVIETDESYTSGTSFLDNELPTKENYNKSRRIKRGLFKSNESKIINSDVNGAFQIIRKVFPKAFEYGIEGGLSPIVINLCK